jgi:hypothetical protein
MDLARRLQRLEARLLVDLAVDGHCELIHDTGEPRELLDQLGKHRIDPIGINVDRLEASGVLLQVIREVDGRHHRQCSAKARGSAHATPSASIPSSTRGGESGSSVKRTPVAWRMALATAASGGTIGTSPTPRTP